MKVFNSYSNQLEDFVPKHDGHVNMYVCGPTVYNYIHIGNARPVIFFDTVRRYFTHLGYKVKFVSNFTDVDDKIIKKAIEENKSELEIANHYIDAFLDDIASVNSSTDYIKPRVTNYMEHIIEFIQELIDNDYAYEIDGDVYFRVNKIKDYGTLSNQATNDLVQGVRIHVNEKKENPLDFTLWKKTEEGIMFDAPFGKGRPGWHTECVAMIDDIFGEQIDIHGGGSGLMFPHHENEIAQAKALHNHRIATYWMHNGLLNIGGNKMSKSEGELILVKDLDVNPNAFRLFMLSAHYRSPINFSKEALEGYTIIWEKHERTYQQLYLKLDLEHYLEQKEKEHEDLLEIYNAFNDAMNQDFNTANAITALDQLNKVSNQLLRNRRITLDILLSAKKLYDDLFDVLGLYPDVAPLSKDDRTMYYDWVQARKEKDFEKADQLRDTLQDKGII